MHVATVPYCCAIQRLFVPTPHLQGSQSVKNVDCKRANLETAVEPTASRLIFSTRAKKTACIATRKNHSSSSVLLSKKSKYSSTAGPACQRLHIPSASAAGLYMDTSCSAQQNQPMLCSSKEECAVVFQQQLVASQQQVRIIPSSFTATACKFTTTCA